MNVPGELANDYVQVALNQSFVYLYLILAESDECYTLLPMVFAKGGAVV